MTTNTSPLALLLAAATMLTLWSQTLITPAHAQSATFTLATLA
jgi:hypothetical protein